MTNVTRFRDMPMPGRASSALLAAPALPQSGSRTPQPPTPEEHEMRARAAHGHGWWPFFRHYLEMIAAMFVGMAVLGAAVRAGLALTGLEFPARPEAAALEMAVDMSAGMIVWMRYRGHGWAATLEMAGSMIVPALALFP